KKSKKKARIEETFTATKTPILDAIA
ncbi:MAG: hypothetical protein RL290_1011, partial [Actinomycetota bacterium]